MRLISTVLFLAYCTCVITAQEFAFSMIFEDACAYRDTIHLGYDVGATDSVDLEYGEINIIDHDSDVPLIVRVSEGYSGFNSTFYLKKQIVAKNCDLYPNAISIDISSKCWPVTATWESSLFVDSCNYGSVFTSVHPGGWWDTGSPSDLDRVDLAISSSAVFTPNLNAEDPNFNYGYITSSNDTFSLYWVAFANAQQLTSVLALDRSISPLYPNPASDHLYLDASIASQIVNTQITDLSGRSWKCRRSSNLIEIDNLPSGLYILQLSTDHHDVHVHKFVKQ